MDPFNINKEFQNLFNQDRDSVIEGINITFRTNIDPRKCTSIKVLNKQTDRFDLTITSQLGEFGHDFNWDDRTIVDLSDVRLNELKNLIVALSKSKIPEKQPNQSLPTRTTTTTTTSNNQEVKERKAEVEFKEIKYQTAHQRDEKDIKSQAIQQRDEKERKLLFGGITIKDVIAPDDKEMQQWLNETTDPTTKAYLEINVLSHLCFHHSSISYEELVKEKLKKLGDYFFWSGKEGFFLVFLDNKHDVRKEPILKDEMNNIKANQVIKQEFRVNAKLNMITPAKTIAQGELNQEMMINAVSASDIFLQQHGVAHLILPSTWTGPEVTSSLNKNKRFALKYSRNNNSFCIYFIDKLGTQHMWLLKNSECPLKMSWKREGNEVTRELIISNAVKKEMHTFGFTLENLFTEKISGTKRELEEALLDQTCFNNEDDKGFKHMSNKGDWLVKYDDRVEAYAIFYVDDNNKIAMHIMDQRLPKEDRVEAALKELGNKVERYARVTPVNIENSERDDFKKTLEGTLLKENGDFVIWRKPNGKCYYICRKKVDNEDRILYFNGIDNPTTFHAIRIFINEGIKGPFNNLTKWTGDHQTEKKRDT